LLALVMHCQSFSRDWWSEIGETLIKTGAVYGVREVDTYLIRPRFIPL
jgi:hypothetical protein